MRNIIRDIKIEIQRWWFRKKYKSGAKKDLEEQTKAIDKAITLSQKRRCRLWVIRVRPGKYVIRSKGDVKTIFKTLGVKGKVDLFQLSDTVVHVTK